MRKFLVFRALLVPPDRFHVSWRSLCWGCNGYSPSTNPCPANSAAPQRYRNEEAGDASTPATAGELEVRCFAPLA